MTKRHKTLRVQIGSLVIGLDSPVAIQSMTNTDTTDVAATVTQICELVDAGSELVRVTVNNEDAALAIPKIKEALVKKKITAPLIGDFHFNGHLLLTKFPECAAALDKYRINPGNVGTGKLHDKNFAMMIEVAMREKKPVRIGANWGSLDRELLTEFMEKNGKLKIPKADSEVLLDALVESAVRSATYAEKLGLAANKIILSVKTSDVNAVVAAYRMLAKRTKYALHLGLTEAGMGLKGVVSSSAALGILLSEGIGDTIRVSLTPEPGAPRAKEVEVCKLLLQSLGLRQFSPSVTSCPGCGRTGSDLFQKIAQGVNEYIKKRMPEWKKMSAALSSGMPKIESMKVAVMGCVVNGPGESQHADIALSLPGKSEEPMALVFIRGKLAKTLRGQHIEDEFLDILEEFAQKWYN